MSKIASKLDEFPLTNIQKSYYMGRNSNFELGGIPTYIYYEFLTNFKHEDLERSFNKLIKNQPMLRSQINNINEQVIIEENIYPYYTIEHYNFLAMNQDEINKKVLDIRNDINMKILSKKHMFIIKSAEINEDTTYVFCFIDMLIADAYSIGILLNELILGCNENYRGPTIDAHFSEYVKMKEEEKDSKRYKKDKEFWLKRLSEIPPAPNIPIKSTDRRHIPQASRISRCIESKVWNNIKNLAKVNNVSPTSVILAAYAMVLGFWSNQDSFTINMPISDRPINRINSDMNMSGVIGDFTSVLLIEIDNSVIKTNVFWNYAKKVNYSILKSLRHRKFDGIEIIREIAKLNNSGDKALMPFVFTSIMSDKDAFDSIAAFGDVKYSISQTPQVLIDCQAMERDGLIYLTWDYVKDDFDEFTVQHMFSKFIDLINNVNDIGTIHEKFYSLCDQDILLLDDYNNTFESIPHIDINTLINDSFTKYENKIAVKDENMALTYGDLKILSDEVANNLKDKNIGVGDYVGVYTARNVYTIVNILGILKCGASYVTINPDYPDKRKEYILNKSKCKLLITEDIINNILAKDCRCFTDEQTVSCDDIAYVMFTSGSTGEPKGVAISHKSVCNTVIDINQKFNVCSDDKFICVTSFCFDLSVYDMFGALSTGAELFIIPDVRDIYNVLNTIRNENITIFNSVPAIMQLLVDECNIIGISEIPSLRFCLLSGDWIPTSLPKKIKRYFPNCVPISLGGATEGSIWSIYHEIKPSDINLSSIPYGRPLANQNMYILYDNHKPCPINTTGEIYIGGVGVADSYINDTEKTNQSFVMTKDYGRIYKTGDYGRISREGIMEFLGRRDFQVKIHGHRIELSEIESVLGKYKNISNAIADIKEISPNNDVLCIFYVSSNNYETCDLSEYLSGYLPHYMIPQYFVKVNEIPLTSNGKVDRKMLVLPKTFIEDLRNNEGTYLSDTESLLCKIWAKFLRIDNINVNTGYFNLGGDSVNMIQIISEINNTFHIDITFQTFLQHSSIREIAALIDKNKSSVYPLAEELNFEISPSDKWDPFKLSDLQESYFIGRNSEDYNGLVTNGYVELECLEYDHEKFYRVLKKLINRHDMLRCAIYEDGTQKILENVDPPKIFITDMTEAGDPSLNLYISGVRRYMTAIKLDLQNPPLIAIQVTKTDEKSAIIHVYVDGLIIDGWSYQLFHLELEQLYRDENFEYEPLEASYRDYIKFKEYQKTTKRYERDKEYWLSRIKILPEAGTLPLIKPLKELDYIEGNQIKCGLSINEWHLLEEKSKIFGVSPFTVIFTSFALTIARWNKSQRFMLNIPEFDRPQFHKDINNIIGICSSFLLFIVDNNPQYTFMDSVVNNHEQLWELKEHNCFSGMEVLREIYKKTKNYDNALVPIVFGMMANVEVPETQSISIKYQENHTTQIWIDITTTLYNDCIEFNWNSIKGLMDYDMLSRMVEIQKDIIHNAIFNNDFWETPCNISLPTYEKDIIDSINNTLKPFEFECFSSIIYKSFILHGEKTFLCDESRTYTYSEIYKYVNNYSQKLLSLGCKKGDYVSIYTSKSIEQIVTILAVNYIGAVYVPIEHEYSKELVLKCIQNIGARYLITNDNHDYFNQFEIITTNDNLIDEELPLMEPIITDEDSLISVINTSGTTGLPKSVMITQKGLLNSIYFTNKKFDVSEKDTLIALTNYAHDMSMYDIFGGIYAGASVAVPKEEKSKDPEHWLLLIRKYNVTIWNSVPAIIQMMVEYYDGIVPEEMKNIRLIISGGDYLKVKLAETLKNNIQDLKLINVGGPTETTLWNICHEVTFEDIHNKIIPYGRPIDNTKYYILNDNMQLCPIGVIGMMYCAGIGITKGYINNPIENLSKYFVWNETNETIYKTGDLGKYDANGNIIFMGRDDSQVEINGKRIEMNGISDTLIRFNGIKNCVVKLNKEKTYIIAYYVSHEDLDMKQLNSYMNEYLPYFEIPKFYYKIDKVPLTNNGKVDFNALPDVLTQEKTSNSKKIALPRDEIEQKLVDVYSEMLGVQADVSTDFFTLGGNSLMAIKMVSRIRDEFEIPISLTEMFSTSTISELYDLICTKLYEKESANIL